MLPKLDVSLSIELLIEVLTPLLIEVSLSLAPIIETADTLETFEILDMPRVYPRVWPPSAKLKARFCLTGGGFWFWGSLVGGIFPKDTFPNIWSGFGCPPDVP